MGNEHLRVQEGFVVERNVGGGGGKPVEAQLANVGPRGKKKGAVAPRRCTSAPPTPIDTSAPMLHTALASYIQPH